MIIDKIRSKIKGVGQFDVFLMIAKGSFWSLTIKMAAAGLSYLMIVMFAKTMTITEFGRFSLGFSIASVLAAFSTIGLPTAILRWFPEYKSTHQEGVANQVMGWACSLTLGVSLSISLLILIGLLIYYGDQAIPPYQLAMVALIVPLTVSEFSGNALRSMGSIIFSQLPRDVLWRIAAILLSAYVFVKGGETTSAFALVFLSLSLLLLILPQFYILYRQSRLSKPTAPPRTREWLGQLPPLWGISLLYASTQYIDTVIVGHFISTELAGAYFAASRTAVVVSLMMVASVMVTAPMISSAYHSGDAATLQRVLRFAAICSFVPTLVFVSVVIALGQPLLRMFDPLFGSAYAALVVLVIGQGVNALSGPMSHLLQLTGHGGYNFKVIAISYVAGLVVQIILIPYLGMVGAAIGSAGAIISWNIASWYYATSRLKVDPTILSVFRIQPDDNDPTRSSRKL